MRFIATAAFFIGLWFSGIADAADSAAPAAGGIKPVFGEAADGAIKLDLSTPDGSSARINFPQRPQTFESLLGRKTFTSVPPPISLPSRRSQQSIDQQNNWAFLMPEDVIDDFMSKEMMKLPEFTADGRERSSLSAVERFYERLARERSPGAGLSRNDQSVQQNLFDIGMGKNGDPNGLIDVKNLGNTFSPSDDFSGRSFDPGWTRPNTLSDMFTSKNIRSPVDDLRERQALQDQLDAFKKALENRNVPSTAMDPTIGGIMSGSLPGSAGAYPSPLAVQPNPYLSGSTIFSRPVAPVAPSISSLPAAYQAPWQNDPSTPLPTTSSLRTTPTKLDFSAPQRRF